eukprot:364505-Chlamydomonas_euryale.AAC.9
MSVIHSFQGMQGRHASWGERGLTERPGRENGYGRHGVAQRSRMCKGGAVHERPSSGTSVPAAALVCTGRRTQGERPCRKQHRYMHRQNCKKGEAQGLCLSSPQLVMHGARDDTSACTPNVERDGRAASRARNRAAVPDSSDSSSRVLRDPPHIPVPPPVPVTSVTRPPVHSQRRAMWRQPTWTRRSTFTSGSGWADMRYATRVTSGKAQNLSQKAMHTLLTK